MSVSKAYRDLQKVAASPEYQTYLTALMIYKEECKRWKKIKNALNPDSENTQEQLQFFLAQRRYSNQCKIYHKALAVYESWRVTRTMKELTPKQMLEMLGHKIPTTMNDLLKEAKQANIEASVSDEQFETIKKAALEHATQSQTTRERFQSSTVKGDPTFDDDAPLPE